MNRFYLKSVLALCLLALCVVSGYAQEKALWTPKTLVDPFTVDSTRYVSNPDTLISPTDVAKIDSVAALIKWQGHLEYGVAVLNEIDGDIFDFSHELYETWGLGQDSRGLLLVIVMDEHEWQFITGYGAEGVLPDALLKRLGENKMVPEFKNDEYGKGILAATEEVLKIVTDDKYYQDEVASMEEEDRVDAMIFLWVIVALILIVGLIATLVERKEKNCYKAPYTVKRKKGISTADSLITIPSSRSMEGTNASLPLSRFVAYYMPAIFAPIASSGIPSTGFLLLLAYTTYVCIMYQSAMGLFLRKKSRDSFEKMQNLRRLNRSYVLILFLFICPWCWLFYKIYYAIVISSMKKHLILTCPKCGTAATEEPKDNLKQYLSEASLCEMKLHSLEHSIFKCPEGHIIQATFDGRNTATYSECPECLSKTMKETSKRVVKKPTTKEKGQQETIYECQFCHHKKTVLSDIPKLESDGGTIGGVAGGKSGGGFGGGSFGGSRGGGFSGGGGARGGW